MNYCDLKEIRQHGDEMMPICGYEISPQSGLRSLSCHWHQEMELFKLERGRMKIQCGDHFMFGEAGSIFFFNSGEIHAGEPEDDQEIVYRAVVFNPEFLCGSDVIRSKYIGPIIAGRLQLPVIMDFSQEISENFEELFRLLEEKDFGYELIVKSTLLKIMAAGIRCSEVMPLPMVGNVAADSIKSAINFIQENHQRPITIEELSALCNMSQGHFCRLFKQYTLKTPIQYINNVRISKAIELLISGNRKILDIALDTGFNGLSYFIGVFKESVGCTPTKFRKEYGRQNKIYLEQENET
ncbi:MAG: AraC family transcriptional regulator [Oscillospiraceae bacterium]